MDHAANIIMRDIKEIADEAIEKEIDLTCVVDKTRDGSSLFQLLADRYVKLHQENSLSVHHEKKTLSHCKSDFLRMGDNTESDWIELTSQVGPINVNNHSSCTSIEAEYFRELDKQWDQIRRTPALDVTDRYAPPVVLSAILRPFLSVGSQFIFSMSPEPLLPFDLGASFPPQPSLSEAEQQKRLTRLMARLETSYKQRQTSIEGIVDLSMLQSFVQQMKENDKVIQSFENISFTSPIEPTKQASDTKAEHFGRRRKAAHTTAKGVPGSSGLFSVNQIRMVHRKSHTHDEWEKKKTKLLEWHVAEEESVQRVGIEHQRGS